MIKNFHFLNTVIFHKQFLVNYINVHFTQNNNIIISTRSQIIKIFFERRIEEKNDEK